MQTNNLNPAFRILTSDVVAVFGSSPHSRELLSPEHRTRGIDVALAAHVQGNALVELAGMDVENAAGAVGSSAARLLVDERVRGWLVPPPAHCLRDTEPHRATSNA